MAMLQTIDALPPAASPTDKKSRSSMLQFLLNLPRTVSTC